MKKLLFSLSIICLILIEAPVYTYEIDSVAFLNEEGNFIIRINNNMIEPYHLKVTDKAQSLYIDEIIYDDIYELKLNPIKVYNINLKFKHKDRSVNYNGKLEGYSLLKEISRDNLLYYIKLNKIWQKGYRRKVISKFIENQLNILGIEDFNINVKFKRFDDNTNAYYVDDIKTIYVNSDFLESNKLSVLPIIAHECRHIYQYDYINKYDDIYSSEIINNLDNYNELDAKYSDNFVEKDANDYAKKYELLPYYISGFEVFNLNKK